MTTTDNAAPPDLSPDQWRAVWYVRKVYRPDSEVAKETGLSADAVADARRWMSEHGDGKPPLAAQQSWTAANPDDPNDLNITLS